MDKKKGIPEAKYTRFGERIRHVIPGPMQCSVGCGGRNCKWENPARWSDEDQAIKGVFSSWVLDDVVAMSRPSTEIIKKFKMMEQFKKHNICSIINLQRPGEHASCGPPLDKESLFTYRPQDFMDNDIFFYNFGWKDYGVTSLHTVLDMVKVMSFALEEGKVAVHCHAGLGRTGVLIACYLVYAYRMDPTTAIMKVRKKRSNSIQTRGQISCINEFWQFLRPLRIVFPQVVPNAKRLTLKQFLTRQRHLLHGLESRELRYTPKLVHVICKRLSDIANGKMSQDNDDDGVEKQITVEVPMRRCHTVAEIRETIPGAFFNELGEKEATESAKASAGLSDSPTDVDAVLSPRVSRKGSAHAVSSSENNRPSSAGAFPLEDDAFVDNQGNINDIVISAHYRGSENPLQATNTNSNSNSNSNVQIAYDVEEPSDSSEQLALNEQSINDGSNLNTSTTSDAVMDESEQIARDVNEILELNQPSSMNGNFPKSTNNNNNATSKLAVAAGEDGEMMRTYTEPVHPEQGVKSLIFSQVSTVLGETGAQAQHAATVRKMRLSASRSETILPTGSPSKNPRNSAKGRKATSENQLNPSKHGDSESPPEHQSSQNDMNSTACVLSECEACPPSSLAFEDKAEDNDIKIRKNIEDQLLTDDDDNSSNLIAANDKGSELIDLSSEDTADGALKTKAFDTVRQSQNVAQEININAEPVVINMKAKPMLMLHYEDVREFTGQKNDEEETEGDLCVVMDDSDKKSSEPSSTTHNTTQCNEKTVKASNEFSPDNSLFSDVCQTRVQSPLLFAHGREIVDEIVSLATDIIDLDQPTTEGGAHAQFHIGSKDTEDDDLDEIINIGDDDTKNDNFLSDSDLENEDNYENTNGSGRSLSNSVASRVSWSKMKQKGNASASSRTSRTGSGRRTPLMYRAEKNIELMEGNGDGSNADRKQSDASKLDVSSEDSESSEEPVDQLPKDEETTQDTGKSTKDNHYLGNDLPSVAPQIARLNSTKSLNDLSSTLQVDLHLAVSRSSSSGDIRNLSAGRLSKQHPVSVALAFANKLVDDEWLWERVYTLQRHINSRTDAWEVVAADTDADLLSALMWSWIEHLAEPLLSSSNVTQMLEKYRYGLSDSSNISSDIVQSFERSMENLDQEFCKTTKCLLSCITQFPPLPKKVSESMVHRTVGALTHCSINSESPSEYREMEQTFQEYINAKFQVLGRKRFTDEHFQETRTYAGLSFKTEISDNDASGGEETVAEALMSSQSHRSGRRSGGSLRSSASSGSSNAGSVVMSAPRIVVN